jgi:cellobiose phosphorylase
MQFGYFDVGNREYVITNPRTPVKWINYIGTRQFGGFVDHTGGALICKDDPTYNRITKYIQQMPSSDFKGETLYLRIHLENGYRIFSPFFVPTLDEYHHYECRIGLGYTRLITEFYNLRTDATIFVPLRGNCELRDIKISNLDAVAVKLDAIPVIEFTHPDALKQFTNADWVPQTMQCQAVEDGNFIILLQYPFMYRNTKINYLTSNLPASSYETDRKIFLGENEYGTYKYPLSLLHPKLRNTQATRGDNIAAILHPLGELLPGETCRLITQLGQADNILEAQPAIQQYREPGNVEAELNKIILFWDSYLATVQVQTPDVSMNAMLNVFNPRQCYVTKTWSRYLSYYQLGLGSRGIGIRDSSQDVLSVMASVPEESKQFLTTLLSFQRPDGSAFHQYNPLTLEGSAGDSLEMEDRPHYYSDDHLWIVLAVTAYLKETGDLPYLDELVPFYGHDKLGRDLDRGTVLEHLERGLAFTYQDVGAHGLPLLGFADWNDTVNLPLGAESLFTANLYGKALLELIALLGHLGVDSRASKYRDSYEEMKSKVEACAWDGEWYIRYFDDEGQPIGSSKNTYGQIYLNGQTWPVISGFATPERARRAMETVNQKLNTIYGLKLSTPGFNGYDPKYGGITTYPPGAKENGGIFVHPNPWAIIAETMLGHGDRAYEYYAQINPATRNNMIEIYECEPYVYAQNILGDEHPHFGLARNSWLTGTAAWCYIAATQHILGIRPEYDGLRIDPCIPAGWDGYSVFRKFRGITMHIKVHNPQKICKGVREMRLDEKFIDGNVIPPDLPEGDHQIEVWLGTK